MKLAVSIPGLIAAGLLASAALAASGPEVASIWDIQPSGAWTEEHLLAKDDVLVEPAIHPRGLIQIQEDVSGGPAGEPLLHKDDLLYRVTVQGAALYCTADAQRPVSNEARFAHTILICIVDRDSDGTFEGYYRKGASKGVPLIFGTIPAELKPVGAIRYSELPTAALGAHFKMRIKLDSDPAKGRQLRFIYEAGYGDNYLPLTIVTEVRNGSFPQVFEALGGLFQVTGVRDGKVVIKMTSPTTLYPYMLEAGSVKT
jgi:hypothetical protein